LRAAVVHFGGIGSLPLLGGDLLHPAQHGAALPLRQNVEGRFPFVISQVEIRAMRHKQNKQVGSKFGFKSV
jgi:hypothetical protein